MSNASDGWRQVGRLTWDGSLAFISVERRPGLLSALAAYALRAGCFQFRAISPPVPPVPDAVDLGDD